MAKKSISTKKPKGRRNNRVTVENLLGQIAAGVSVKSSQDFFQSLVQGLTKTLKVDYAFIAKLTGTKHDSMATVSACKKGKIIDNFSCEIAGTPYEEIVIQGIKSYPKGLKSKFTGNKIIAGMQVDSCIGVALKSSSGETLGILVVMDNMPISTTKTAESVLRIFATRATDELERKAGRELLEHRLKFERLITTISNRFINLSPNEIDLAINESLAVIGKFSNVDRSYVFQFDEKKEHVTNTHEWCKQGVTSFKDKLVNIPIDKFSWIMGKHKRAEVVYIEKITDLPAEAEAEKIEFRKQGIQSLLSLPLMCAGKIIGYVGFDSVLERKSWPQEAISLQRIVGEVFANALERKRSENILTDSRALNQAILDSLGTKIAVLDCNAQVIAINDAWGRLAGLDNSLWFSSIEKGVNFLSVCRNAGTKNNIEIEKMLAGISAVLAGEKQGFSFEYMHDAVQQHWFILHVTKLRTEQGGVVIAYEDLTALKRTDLALRDSQERLELALSASNIGLWSWNLRTNEVYFSRYWKAQLGYQEHEINNEFEEWSSRLHPDDEKRVLRMLDNYLKNPVGPYQSEFRLRHRDGSYKWIYTRADTYRELNGKAERMMGCHIDVTERKRAEEEQQKFVSLVENSADFIALATMQKNLIYVNRAGKKLVGLQSDEQVKSTNINDYLFKEDIEVVEKTIIPAVTKSGQWEGEFRFRNFLTGKPITIYMNTFLVREPKTREPIAIATVSRDITDRKHAEEVLREMSEAMENAVEGISQLDSQKCYTSVNKSYATMTGYTPDELVGKNWLSMVHPDDHQKMHVAYDLMLETGKVEIEVRARRKDGTNFYTSLVMVPSYDKSKTLTGHHCFIKDISDRKRGEQALKESEERFRSLVEHATEAIVVFDCDSDCFIDVNENAERLFGLTREALLKIGPTALSPELQPSGDSSRELMTANIQEALEGGTPVFEWTHRDGKGQLLPCEVRFARLPAAGKKLLRGSITDITERKLAEERLHFLAHHDILTKLPNRILFMDRLNQALIRAHWRTRALGVMFLDLDRFKSINDTLGHNVGDRFLQAVSTRLCECVREGDTVARIGGDEFAILLDDVAHPEDVSLVAKKILEAFVPPFIVDDYPLYTSASVGISLYPNDGDSASSLLRNADAAMYRAKELGKNNYQFYSADLSAMAFERLALETSLRRALERDEFRLYYQPQVDLRSGRIIGVEALIRWQHPEFGLIAPIQFLALAEETGLIVPIDKWVAHTAGVQARLWREQGIAPMRLSLNLTSREINESQFVESIGNILAESGLQAPQLELEFTEGIVMKNVNETMVKLNALHDLGVRFAIDDFGTGYSSLNQLRRLPLNTLKIDRSFIYDAPTNSNDGEIVRAIIAMAHTLKLEVIAEGVETDEQLAFLRACECDVVQGYLFSKPLPAEDLSAMLAEGKVLC